MSIINKNIEVVVAKYNENIDWVKKLREDIKITVYDKSENPIFDSYPLTNIGRETHTYFTHIVNNYDNLSDFTFFCQGDPIYHISYFIDLVNRFPNVHHKPTLIINECFFYNTAYNNKLIESDNFGKPHDYRGINVNNTWKLLFESKQPNIFYFSPGCQFVITKEQLRKKEKKFYEKCLKITYDNKFAPWEFERIMRYVVDPNFK